MNSGNIVALLLCASIASAQEPSPAWQMFRQNTKPGDHIRIETRNRPVSGKVERITADSVGIRHGSQTTDISVNDVDRIYQVGSKSRHAARTTLIGLGVGAGAGAATGAAAAHGSEYTGLITALFAVVGGIVGTAVGAVIGAVSSQRTLVYQRP